MSVPTKHATAGRFQSKNGEDVIHHLDKTGKIVYWVDSDGVAYGPDYITESGTSILSLKAQLESAVFSGLPSVIDCGEF